MRILFEPPSEIARLQRELADVEAALLSIAHYNGGSGAVYKWARRFASVILRVRAKHGVPAGAPARYAYEEAHRWRDPRSYPCQQTR
jgi:hypothetical protein